MQSSSTARRPGCLYDSAAGLEVDLSAEEGDPRVLSHDEEDALLAGAPWTRCAALGDSIVEGVADEVPGYAPVHFTGRLVDALRRRQPAIEFLHLGKRDLRAAEIREQQLARALDWGPDLVLVGGGGNDMMAERFDAEHVTRELTALIEPFASAGTTVVTWTLFDITKALTLPPELGSEIEARLHAFFDVARAVAREQDVVLVDFALDSASGDGGVYSKDFRHANARGHAIAAAGAIRSLAALLGNEPAA